jgi:hypothetical protein
METGVQRNCIYPSHNIRIVVKIKCVSSVAQREIWSPLTTCFEIDQLGTETCVLCHRSDNATLLFYRTSISTGKIRVYQTDAPVRGAHTSYFRSGMRSVCSVAPTRSTCRTAGARIMLYSCLFHDRNRTFAFIHFHFRAVIRVTWVCFVSGCRTLEDRRAYKTNEFCSRKSPNYTYPLL